MLAVVKDEQERGAGAQGGAQGVRERDGARLAHPERPRDRRHDQRRVGQRRQGHEDHPAGEAAGGRRGDGQGQPGLADAAWAKQGYQARRNDGARICGAQQPRDRRHVRLAPNQRGRGDWQGGHARRGGGAVVVPCRVRGRRRRERGASGLI